MNPSDFNLIAEKGRKGKMDTFQVLNYQHDAHLSSRGMDKTNQLVKQQTGFQVLPGRHLLDEAKKTTYPEKILSDDYNVEVSLQRALDKTVERLLHSDEINNEVKEIIKEKRKSHSVSSQARMERAGSAKTTNALVEALPSNK